MKVKTMQLGEVKVGQRVAFFIGSQLMKGEVIIQLGNGDTVIRNLDGTTFIQGGNREVTQLAKRRK